MNQDIQLILIDCDGTCYPSVNDFNGRFKSALKETAAAVGISTDTYDMIGQQVRKSHRGMMNFILALCQGDLTRFQDFTRLWCDRLDYRCIQPNPMLGKYLEKMPISTCIFTNNCRTHLNRVWGRLFGEKLPSISTLTIEDTYDGHWFHPKQSQDGFLRICTRQKALPSNTIVLDDSPIIIDTARQAGLQVRLITQQYPLISCLNDLVHE